MVLNTKINRIKTIETGLLAAAVVLYMAWRSQNWELVSLALLLLMLSLIVPIVFYPLAKIWFGLGLLLGLISTKILLSLLFFIIVTPIGVFRKLSKKDVMSLKLFKNNASSTLLTRNHHFTAEDLKNQF
jgi:multisubunit Na+/H+ antiporter MnhG subunit